MSLNLPPSWPRLSPHARACYLVDAHLAKNYADARRKVGRMEREAKRKITVAQYQETLSKRGLD